MYASDGMLYNPDIWDTANNDLAIGVAVVTDNCRFAVSKELPMVNNIAWSDVLRGNVDGLTDYHSSSTARTDYSGQSNTNIIRSQSSGENSSNNAAHYCYAQTLNGQNGYLPATGELYTLRENKTYVNNILTTIGATAIDTVLGNIHSTTYHYLWASAEDDMGNAWLLHWEGSSSYFGYSSKGNVFPNNYAFPMFPITSTVTLTLHIADGMITLQFRKGDSINLSYYVPSAYTSVFMGWHKLEDLSEEVITQIDSIQDDMILYANTGNTPDNP